MNKNKISYINYSSIMIITYFVMPKFNNSFLDKLMFLTLVILMAIAVFIISKNEKVNFFSFIIEEVMSYEKLKSLLLVSSIYSVYLFILFFNRNINVVNAFLNAFKIFFFLGILFVHYVISKRLTSKKLYLNLLQSAYILIGFELIVSFTQLFNFQVFNIIYNPKNVHGLGSILRIPGSLYNPTTFSWLMIFLLTIIVFLERNIKKMLGTVIVIFFSVVLSGSRTMLMVFPFYLVTLFPFFLKSRRIKFDLITKRKLVITFVLTITSIMILLLIFIFNADETFRYLADLKNVFKPGGLRNINSFVARIDRWSYAVDRTFSSFGNLLFGGLKDINYTVDNSLIYTIGNQGVIGLAFHSSILYLLLRNTFSKEGNYLKYHIWIYFFFSIILGIMSESLSGWIIPIFLYYLIGLYDGRVRKNNELSNIVSK